MADEKAEVGDKTPLSPFESAKKSVEDLYSFRDHYFSTHGIERAIHKQEDVDVELQKTLEVLDSLQDQIINKAGYLMLRGKALNIVADFDNDAKEALAKAVKLDPKLVDAWVQLGECYWKNKEIEAAKNCFLGALNHSKDKVALRNLSMVLRQLGSDASERTKHIEESVEKAKEAVHLDLKDGTSWFILGNAYLSLFFAGSQSPKILKQCMSAYQQAERDDVACCNADLHFNRATAYKYQEEYDLALLGFARASALDPMWCEPQEKENLLLDYLSRVQDLIKTKGKMKSKKLQGLVNSIKDSDLGPYTGGSYTSPHGKTVKLEVLPVDKLVPMVNTEKVVLGKVVCSLVTEEPIPFTFCMVDKSECCVAVTVYNIAPGYGVKIGDSVAIPEPYLQPIDLQYKDKIFAFKNIRVDSPVVMVVNGRKLGLDKQAPSVLSVSAMSE